MCELLVHRYDLNYFKKLINPSFSLAYIYRANGKTMSESLLKSYYLIPIVWRFCELIAIWAAVFDNNDEIYTTLDNSNKLLNKRDILLVGLIFCAIYLLFLLIEFIIACYDKTTFKMTIGEELKNIEATIEKMG